MAKPAHQRAVAAPGWLLPVCLAASVGELEPVVDAIEQVGAACIVGVGVEDAVAMAEKSADAVHLTGPAVPLRSASGQVPVVVFDRGYSLIEGDVEVVVEVAAEGGIPGNDPAHPLPER